MDICKQMGNMLVLLVLFMGTAVAQRGGGGGRGNGYVDTCSTQFPTAANDLVTFSSSGQTTSNDLKCFMSCVMQAKGLMTSTGTIAMGSGPGASLPAAQSAAIQPCFQLTPSSDLCETAYQHNKCMWENDSTRSFLKLFQRKGSYTG